jgi:hypothetical protein
MLTLNCGPARMGFHPDAIGATEEAKVKAMSRAKERERQPQRHRRSDNVAFANLDALGWAT